MSALKVGLTWWPTAVSSRVPGLLLVVVLSLVPALAPAPAHGTPGDAGPYEPFGPFEMVAARPPQDRPVGVWPLRPDPEVAADFDPPLDPWGSGHRGVDLLGTAGQTVRSALAGRVTFAGMLAGRGVVVVSHGETRTTYEPVSAAVSVGDTVAGGDPIGRLESVGSHCFPRACLHWGWLRGETYLDPLDLVGAQPVRLLPLWRDVPLPGWSGPVPHPLLGLLPAGPTVDTIIESGRILRGRND
ncbi:M23 family metallopeptidase [Nocardioides sp.]|uniref:M23 family metallopeptidase n=1 Tax=Nocardioides sp. TaxID=35761 RepID=UPI002D80478D|nr:M23 family metallopeptidase [Nocardioides sp.]HET8961696.1 M23 family metallopeptidase [Nocardioides sp.]